MVVFSEGSLIETIRKFQDLDTLSFRCYSRAFLGLGRPEIIISHIEMHKQHFIVEEEPETSERDVSLK